MLASVSVKDKDNPLYTLHAAVYRKDKVKLDGSDPMLLDAYGSYGICNDPSFDRNALSLLDRGFVYAIAHVRGGGELGRYW